MSKQPTDSIPSSLVHRQRLIDRFLRYVAIDTSADPASNSYPSSPNQTKLANLVAEDLRALGIDNVEVDQHSLVWAWLPGNPKLGEPILLNSHLDTSPEASAKNIQARVIDNYDGHAIELSQGITIDAENTPELPELVGKQLIVTDGTTLLGGDDKAGVAVIVELLATLLDHKLEHRPIQVLFTCDEEIGQGTKCIDLNKCRAKFGFTLDGSGQGILEAENFSADLATIEFKGLNIHPAIAKGRMVNALKAASMFVNRLPGDGMSPETTDGRQGFMHPYSLDGQVGEANLRVLLRSFETTELDVYRRQLESLAQQVYECFPGVQINVKITQQYRNMADGIRQRPDVTSLAWSAYERIGLTPKLELIRGGTDGAVMTAKGIPMPNLATGQHNIHSVREFVCVDEMVNAIRHLLAISSDRIQPDTGIS